MEKTNEVAVLHGIHIQILKEKGITLDVCVITPSPPDRNLGKNKMNPLQI